MKKLFAVTPNRMDKLLLLSILPLIVIVIGVICVFFGICINKTFLITFLMFPLLVIALLSLCVFSSMRHGKKAVLSALILFLLVVLFLGGMFFGTFVNLHRYTNDELRDHYVSIPYDDEQMPTLNEIGQPIKTEYCKVRTRCFIFCPEADYLICQYTPEEYALQKNSLDAKYTFQTETMYCYDDFNAINTYPCEPMAELDGYQFSVLSTELNSDYYDIGYPKHMNLIAWSDERNEIVYLSFYDLDLDYLTTLTDFLYEDCGWKFVR